MELIVSYVGRPMIGSMVGFRSAPTMSALAVLIRSCQDCGGNYRVRAMVDLTRSGLWWIQGGEGHGGFE